MPTKIWRLLDSLAVVCRNLKAEQIQAIHDVINDVDGGDGYPFDFVAATGTYRVMHGERGNWDLDHEFVKATRDLRYGDLFVPCGTRGIAVAGYPSGCYFFYPFAGQGIINEHLIQARGLFVERFDVRKAGRYEA